MRAGTRAHVLAIICALVKACKDSTGVDAIIAGFYPSIAKSPKAIAFSIACLTSIITQFGLACGRCKDGVVSPLPVVKGLAALFAHKDKNVRAAGAALADECVRFLGICLSVLCFRNSGG
jgi:hypothetical protein